MENVNLINRLRALKQERSYTLHDLSKKLDIQVTTIERWLQTNRINKVYAEVLENRLENM